MRSRVCSGVDPDPEIFGLPGSVFFFLQNPILYKTTDIWFHLGQILKQGATNSSFDETFACKFWAGSSSRSTSKLYFQVLCQNPIWISESNSFTYFKLEPVLCKNPSCLYQVLCQNLIRIKFFFIIQAGSGSMSKSKLFVSSSMSKSNPFQVLFHNSSWNQVYI